MTSIITRLRTLSQDTYCREHRDIMIDAARRIETLEAAQPRDAKCPGDIYDDLAAAIKERYFIEEGRITCGPGGSRARPHWKIYDRSRRAPAGSGPACVAYFYVESVAHEVLGNLNNPAKEHNREYINAIAAATSRCLGVSLADHVKHLEELAVDRLRLLDDQTAKLYLGLSAEQWYGKFAEQVSLCSAAEYAARGASDTQYYEGHSAMQWHKKFVNGCAEIGALRNQRDSHVCNAQYYKEHSAQHWYNQYEIQAEGYRLSAGMLAKAREVLRL